MHVNIGYSRAPPAECALPVTNRSKKVSAAQFREFCLEGDIAGARRFKGCVDTRELRGEYGDTGLTLALKAGEEDLVKVLVEEMGADVSRCSRDGRSPVSVAAGLRDVEMVRYLLEKGADPNASCSLNEAITASRSLPEEGEEKDEALDAVREIVRLLVDNGAVLPFGTGECGDSTLCRAPSLDFWPDLIRAGGDPNWVYPGRWNHSPDWRNMAHWAHPLKKICEICWEGGVEVDLFHPDASWREGIFRERTHAEGMAFTVARAIPLPSDHAEGNR